MIGRMYLVITNVLTLSRERGYNYIHKLIFRIVKVLRS